MTIYERHYFEVRCDLDVARYCHKSFAAPSSKEALSSAREAGFVEMPDGQHACPMCHNVAARGRQVAP